MELSAGATEDRPYVKSEARTEKAGGGGGEGRGGDGVVVGGWGGLRESSQC